MPKLFRDDNKIQYQPVQHPFQPKALPYHVMIMYLNEVYDNVRISDGACWSILVFIFGILVMIAGIIMAGAIQMKTMYRIICIVGGIAFCLITFIPIIITKKQRDKKYELEPSTGYSYYYYDIIDQCVKFIQIDNDGQIVDSYTIDLQSSVIKLNIIT